jgi:hypothetical protein
MSHSPLLVFCFALVVRADIEAVLLHSLSVLVHFSPWSTMKIVLTLFVVRRLAEDELHNMQGFF